MTFQEKVLRVLEVAKVMNDVTDAMEEAARQETSQEESVCRYFERSRELLKNKEKEYLNDASKFIMKHFTEQEVEKMFVLLSDKKEYFELISKFDRALTFCVNTISRVAAAESLKLEIESQIPPESSYN